ncbi:hypothetical protein PR202_ga08730 [Eleusine coracana subsp. coracana]|uniref:Uncharacterized protein n=1 Tax=Eleusine coracana subsp. coracana TaxID=191504 RepID=A0AAV5C3E0_ELECO|nr:hypothetical protein PR202_ga08730 [Eleusine coracana subsp. coracana]
MRRKMAGEATGEARMEWKEESRGAEGRKGWWWVRRKEKTRKGGGDFDCLLLLVSFGFGWRPSAASQRDGPVVQMDFDVSSASSLITSWAPVPRRRRRLRGGLPPPPLGGRQPRRVHGPGRLLLLHAPLRVLLQHHARLAASPSGDFLLAADDKGRALYANLRRRAVLHRVSFKGAPSAISFSPDGELIAVAVGKVVQIWRSPAFRREFFPFHLLRTFPGFAAGVTAFDWSPDSAFLLASCKDLTARILPVKKGLGGKPFLFLGHRAALVGAFFATDKKTGSVNGAYTISKDGAIFTWNLVQGNDASPPPSPGTPEAGVGAE